MLETARKTGGWRNGPCVAYDDFCRPFASSHFDLPEEQLMEGAYPCDFVR